MVIYDNHYAMAAQLGQIINNPEYPASSPYQYTLTTFGKYMTPVYSEFNSTSRVSIEITGRSNEKVGRSQVLAERNDDGIG